MDVQGVAPASRNFCRFSLSMDWYSSTDAEISDILHRIVTEALVTLETEITLSDRSQVASAVAVSFSSENDVENCSFQCKVKNFFNRV